MRRALGFGIAVILLFPTVLLAARPSPPARFESVIEQVREIEAFFHAGKWDEAQKEASAVATALAAIRPDLEKGAGGKLLDDLDLAYRDFKVAIRNQEKARAEELGIQVELIFFDISDAFEYKVPLVIKAVDAYLGESQEELDKGEVEAVARQLNEVTRLFKKGEKALMAKGVAQSEMGAFMASVQDVRRHALLKKKEKVEQGLAGLREMSKGFLSEF